MALHVGTSGWQYAEWKGSFYPEKISAAKMLAYYGERFDSVEVNNTFYRLPKPGVLKGWAEQVPAGFSFVIKASQRITHHKKLGPEAADTVKYMLGCCAELGDRLGPVLYQTPPWLKKDVAVLKGFLALLPEGHKAAFEFRSTTWFDDEVYAALVEPYLFIDRIPEGAVVLDCRPPHQFRAWHYPGAEQHAPHDVATRLKQLSKERTYVLYCEYGVQTAHLAELLQRVGYEAYSFRGGAPGLRAWSARQPRPDRPSPERARASS